jgi:hypothetical protein
MAQALGPSEGKGSLDPGAIDTDVVARTVLVGRLLGLAPGPLAPLPQAAITKFKLDFSKDPQLPETATHRASEILRAASPTGHLEGAALEVASRWIRGLCPLAPVLGAYDPA